MTQQLLTVKIDQVSVTLPIRSILQALLDGIAAQQPRVLETPPRIGERWPGKGGFYAGIGRGYNGESDHHLILFSDIHAGEKLNWDVAMKWASDINMDGHNDFTLPTRRELALLYANMPETFQNEWYWSSEQPAAGPTNYAWVHNFSDGDQNFYHKSNRYSACAIRRVVVTR